VRRSDDPEQVEQDLAEIWVAHDARFASLGKASGLTDGHRAAVRHAVPRLVPRGHLRVWVIEHNGRVVGGQIHVRAGDAMYFFNGGMTPGWEREGPGMVLLHAAVEDAHGLDARCVDLGPGAFPYKLRFADTIRQVSSHDLFAIDPRYVVTRARLAPKHLAIAARRRFTELPEQRQLAIKRMLRRG
jgi:CelD/BcsL family acetyltransferase involved in cellulose biosynthesis